MARRAPFHLESIWNPPDSALSALQAVHCKQCIAVQQVRVGTTNRDRYRFQSGRRRETTGTGAGGGVGR